MTAPMTALRSVSARPVHYTSRPAEVVAPLETLGLVRVEGTADADWQVLHAPGGGDLAVHAVPAGDPLDGTTRLGFEADDLEAVLAALPASVDAGLVEEAHGRALRITAPEGYHFLVDTRPPRRVPAGDHLPGRLELSQMWFGRDVPAMLPILEALGAATLVTSPAGPDGPEWVDTRMPAGGRTQLHAEPTAPYASAGFVFAGRLEELRDRLDAAGFTDAAVIDESYGRYLELAPDGLHRELAWVNEEQRDYYGYVVHQDPAAAGS